MAEKLRAIIVDDEQKARNILENLLTAHCPDILIEGLASNVPEALKLIHTLTPDVVFLDIEMPGYTGFQLLEMIPDPQFQVVFTTAYSEYALKAFEVSAIDYLLKPIRIQKLINAVEKLKKYRPDHYTPQRISALQANLKGDSWKKLCLPVADGYVFLEFSDIECIEAEGSYTRIHKRDGSFIIVSKLLRDLEGQLSNVPNFLRCHRSYIINTQLITKWVKSDGGSLLLKSGKEVPINKESKETLMQMISSSTQ
jgi:two-component system, LytTR family, response regulator